MKILIALLVLVCLSGCASLQRGSAGHQLVAQYAVGKYLEQRNADKRYESAQAIIRIAEKLRARTQAIVIPVDQLRPIVTELIRQEQLSPADFGLATGLANILFEEFELRLKPGTIEFGQPMEIEELLDWITSVARTIPSPQ